MGSICCGIHTSAFTHESRSLKFGKIKQPGLVSASHQLRCWPCSEAGHECAKVAGASIGKTHNLINKTIRVGISEMTSFETRHCNDASQRARLVIASHQLASFPRPPRDYDPGIPACQHARPFSKAMNRLQEEVDQIFPERFFRGDKSHNY